MTLHFASKPPRFTFEEVRNPDSGEILLREYVDGALRREYALIEEALTTTVVKLLREKGWTVTPPTADIIEEIV
jgi:hypothetical protein